MGRNKQTAYKIRKVNKKTDALEIGMPHFVEQDGYKAGVFAEWERLDNGEWKLKLQPKRECAKTDVPVAEAEIVEASR